MCQTFSHKKQTTVSHLTCSLESLLLGRNGLAWTGSCHCVSPPFVHEPSETVGSSRELVMLRKKSLELAPAPRCSHGTRREKPRRRSGEWRPGHPEPDYTFLVLVIATRTPSTATQPHSQAGTDTPTNGQTDPTGRRQTKIQTRQNTNCLA